MKTIVKSNAELIALMIQANTSQVFVTAERTNRLYKVSPVVLNIDGVDTNVEVSRLIPRELRMKSLATGEAIMFTVITQNVGHWEMDSADSIFGFIKRGETFQSFKIQSKPVAIETAGAAIAKAESTIVQKAIETAVKMTDKESAMLAEITELGLVDKEVIAVDRSTTGVLGSLIKKGLVRVEDGLVAVAV